MLLKDAMLYRLTMVCWPDRPSPSTKNADGTDNLHGYQAHMMRINQLAQVISLKHGFYGSFGAVGDWPGEKCNLVWYVAPMDADNPPDEQTLITALMTALPEQLGYYNPALSKLTAEPAGCEPVYRPVAN